MSKQNRTDVIAELQALLQRKPARGESGYLTIREIRAKLRWTEHRTRAYLRDLWDEGRVEVTHVTGEGMDGRHTRVPAYRIKAP